jgi:hypothetical protein
VKIFNPKIPKVYFDVYFSKKMGFGIIIYFDVYFSKVDPLVESDEIQVAERIKRRCKCYCFNKAQYFQLFSPSTC